MAIGKAQSTAAILRSEIVTGLISKRCEIERLANHSIARIGPGIVGDLSHEYADGVERVLESVLDYVFACLNAGSTAVEPVPMVPLEQARRAAKAGVGLDVVLRRYTAGDRALRRILACELAGLDRAIVDDVHIVADEAIDSVMRCVAAEFDAEAARLSRLSNPVLIQALGLLKEEVHVAELDGYLLDRWHIGLVSDATVPRAGLLRLARGFGAQSLVVDSQLGQSWVWIGTNQPIVAAGVEAALTKIFDQRGVFGLGEPRKGIAGWRLTHTEARGAAGLPGAVGRRVTRMRRHVLEAAVLDNRAYTESLIATYIQPLEDESAKLADDLRQTLHAYLRSGQNAKSAAEHLGIDRHTVCRRVRKFEELVGERIEDCFAQLDIALRLATIPDQPIRH